MTSEYFGDDQIKSSNLPAEQRAIVRALLTRQLSQRPHDVWDGITNLVGAISGRIARDHIDKIEMSGQKNAKATFAPIIDALQKRRSAGAGELESARNLRLNPGQQAIVNALLQKRVNASEP
jgi:hypothetical protein